MNCITAREAEALVIAYNVKNKEAVQKAIPECMKSIDETIRYFAKQGRGSIIVRVPTLVKEFENNDGFLDMLTEKLSNILISFGYRVVLDEAENNIFVYWHTDNH